MSDRVKSLLVVLSDDFKDEDVEELKKAILQFKKVYSVTTRTTSFQDYEARQRIKAEFIEKAMEFFK